MDSKNEIRIGVRELRGKLSYYIGLAATGTTILVTSRDSVVAVIDAPKPEPTMRRFGRLKGRIHMAEDFIELPDDVLDAMES